MLLYTAGALTTNRGVITPNMFLVTFEALINITAVPNYVKLGYY